MLYCRGSSNSFTDVAMPVSLEAAQVVWVDTVERLMAMKVVLQQHDSFALDLEHHAEHSYLGLTCLLQINAGGCQTLVLLVCLTGYDYPFAM